MERRNTQAKKAILKVLRKTKRAMSRDAIQDMLSSDINRATVYRILNQFNEDDIVHRVVADDGKQYFATNDIVDSHSGNHSQNHVHFRCMVCSLVECVEMVIENELPEGYVAKSHNFVISGICKTCT